MECSQLGQQTAIMLVLEEEASSQVGKKDLDMPLRKPLSLGHGRINVEVCYDNTRINKHHLWIGKGLHVLLKLHMSLVLLYLRQIKLYWKSDRKCTLYFILLKYVMIKNHYFVI